MYEKTLTYMQAFTVIYFLAFIKIYFANFCALKTEVEKDSDSFYNSWYKLSHVQIQIIEVFSICRINRLSAIDALIDPFLSNKSIMLSKSQPMSEPLFLY